MLPVFLVTFPFFALIAAGYAAARRGVLPLEAIPGLNIFVLYFALPCMLFRFGAGTPIGQLLDGSVALVWGLGALLVVGVHTPEFSFEHEVNRVRTAVEERDIDYPVAIDNARSARAAVHAAGSRPVPVGVRRH